MLKERKHHVRHVIYDPSYIDSGMVRELENDGFLWAGSDALYHSSHWSLSARADSDYVYEGQTFKALTAVAMAWLYDE